MAGPEARVLSYHDVLLRRADVDLLMGPEWLNDQLIAFYFTYLLEDRHPGLADRVCLMPPGTSFLLLNSDPSESAMIFEALKLHEKELVIFAVNDNPDVEYAAGGSHWSCLAYHRPSNTFRHFDSAAGTGNTSVGKDLAGAAAPLVRSKGGLSGATSQQPSFTQVAAMPKQQNGYDCGLYVCAVADALCSLQTQQQAARTQPSSGPGTPDNGSGGGGSAVSYEQQEAAVLQTISSASVVQLRQQMLDLIRGLAAAIER